MKKPLGPKWEYRVTFAFHDKDGTDKGRPGYAVPRTRIYRQQFAMAQALKRRLKGHSFEQCPRSGTGWGAAYSSCPGWVAKVERRLINPWEATTFEVAGLE